MGQEEQRARGQAWLTGTPLARRTQSGQTFSAMGASAGKRGAGSGGGSHRATVFGQRADEIQLVRHRWSALGRGRDVRHGRGALWQGMSR